MGGGDWAFAWGNQDDSESVAAIRAGIDAGLNWIDNAAVYGLGHSEEVVGNALAGMSKKPYVFTKCGRNWDDDRKIVKLLKKDAVRQECENSLRRLKVDTIDLYQMHWPEPDEDIEEGWAEMVRLRDEGKARWIGVSNYNASQLARISTIETPTSLQPPYSLVSPEIEADQLPYCAEHNIGVLVYSPMRHGLLSGKMTKERVAEFPENDFRKRSPHFQEPALSKNLALAGKLGEIGARHGRTAGEAAIAWTLRNPVVTAAIVGLRNADQAKGIIGAAEFRLSSGELAEIEAFSSASATA
jgi:aryl-alcohol dehydrogenase-like predicted oxidoreductase